MASQHDGHCIFEMRRERVGRCKGSSDMVAITCHAIARSSGDECCDLPIFIEIFFVEQISRSGDRENDVTWTRKVEVVRKKHSTCKRLPSNQMQ